MSRPLTVAEILALVALTRTKLEEAAAELASLTAILREQLDQDGTLWNRERDDDD